MDNNKKEFYVENYDFNAKKIYMFNIFDHWKFSEDVEKLNKENLNFEEYCERLRRDLQYYFWSRREYERIVGDAFETDLDKFVKIDVYQQCLPNLYIIAKIARGEIN